VPRNTNITVGFAAFVLVCVLAFVLAFVLAGVVG